MINIKGSSVWALRNNLHFLLFIGIAFLLIFSIVIFPFAYAVYFSLCKIGMRELLTGKRPFVGLDGYTVVLQDPVFWQVFLQTLRFTAEVILLELVVALGIAMVMNVDFWGGSLLLSLVLLPWAVPPVVNGTMWRFLYNAKFGWINGFLYSVGIIDTYKTFLSKPSIIIEVIVSAYTWRVIPFSTILLYAGLKTIPGELYEAGMIDGASRWDNFRFITLPLLRPVILILLVMRTMFELRAFDEIFALTFGGPGNSSWVWSFFIYMTGFRFFQFGKASVAAVLLGAFTMCLVFVYVKVFSIKER